MTRANGGAADVEAGGGTGAAPVAAAAPLFAGPSELHARCRTHDWAETPLGPAADWAPALRLAVGLCLDAGFATCLYAGDDLTLVYNDGFRAALGRKHPWALGRTAREVWPEAWAQIAPDFARVRTTGEPVVRPDQRFVLDRGMDAVDEGFFTFAFSAVRDEAGAVLGVLSTVAETTARVRAERGLEAERERLRSLILQMPAPVALHEGPEHRYTLVNAFYQRISGDWRTVAGRTPPEAFPELVGSGIFETLDRVYATGEPWSAPERPLPYDRDGSGRIQDAWFSIRFEPVRDADGQVVGIVNFSLDVTEQVRARREVEAMLVESEGARVEAEAARTEAEHAARQLQDQAVAMELQAEALQVTAAQLEERTEEAEASRRRAEAERGRVTATLEAMSDAYFALDADFRIVAVNAAMVRSTSLSRDALLGRVMWDVFPATAGTQYERHYRAAMTEGAEAHFTDTYDDGRLALVCEVDVYPVAGGGVAVFWRDVTARVQATAERERLLAAAEQARAAAEAANQAKSQFLAVMSHELRTPLNAIGGYTELIEIGVHGPVTPEQRTALERIQRSQRHLLGLISGVLDYARVEAGAVAYRLADVPVVEVVAEAETLIAPQLRAKGLGYAWSGAPPDLRVRADREKLQQVLLNLLGNAVKFTHPRDGVPGRIDVACALRRAPNGEPVGDSGDRICLTVRDTGDGIAAEQLAHIFEPFVQVDQRFTRRHDGVGLGLAISRDLARGMGGDLTVESTPGAGSTFTLVLPRSRTDGA